VVAEVLSGALNTRLQAYAYKAFTAARIPQAFCTVYDTGLQGSQISAF
jgi:hypothetical protein